MEDLRKKIFSELEGAIRIVFMGIGEEKLSDDGVGPYIITQLLDHSDSKFQFLNAGIDPMVRIDDIISFSPSHLVLLDTCTLDAEPGTVAVLKRDNISEYAPISTHTIPVHVVVDLIMEKLPNLHVFMIGIVPKSLKGFTELELFKHGELSIDELNENDNLPFFAINLTPVIKEVADRIIEIIKDLIS